ncbi:MAG: DUF935 family protein, partial [Gammaproteobacteria bacterium]|nr:DUF935 family protein [Gammaproteobacteria bacterium]
MNLIQNLKSLFAEKPRQTETLKAGTEISTYKSPYYQDSYDFPYNPDDIVEQKGYEAYDEMGIDDQVKASFKTKKILITSRPWDIIPASEDKSDQDIANFIKYALDDGFRGVFKDTINEMLSALQYGFSLTEKVFKIFPKGEYKGKIGIKALKTRPPHGFEFDIDDFGNIIAIRQHQPNGNIPLPPKKFILYTYDSEFGSPYGKSDFRSAYRSWFIKSQIVKYWAMYLERHGMPFIVGKYKKGTPQGERSALRTILERMQAKSVATYPNDLDIEFLEAKNGTIDFQSAVDMHNTMITRSFLLPELLGLSSHKTGSQSLGVEQFDMFYKILEDIQVDVEDLINESLIRELVNMNFANVDDYPKFEFVPLDSSDKDKLYNIWITAVEKGVVKNTKQDEDYLRQQLGFPEREGDDVAGDTSNDMPIEEPKERDIKGDPKEEEPKKADIDKEDIKDEKFAEKVEKGAIKRSLSKFEENNNIGLVQDDYNKLGVGFATDVSNVVANIRDSIMINIKRKKIIQNKDFEAVRKLAIPGEDKKEMTKAFMRNLNLDYKTAKKTGSKQVVESKPDIKLAEVTGGLIPKDAINYLENKGIEVSGVELDYILKNVKQILSGGLKTGKSEAEIVFELNNFFKEYDFSQKLPDGSEANIQDIKGRLNTVVRTNLNDAYNQGRIASFNDPNVNDFIAAYEYTAILDDVTTDFCRSYDGKIYAKDDPIWSSLMPPNHYNCRSTVVPVFKTDEYKSN